MKLKFEHIISCSGYKDFIFKLRQNLSEYETKKSILFRSNSLKLVETPSFSSKTIEEAKFTNSIQMFEYTRIIVCKWVTKREKKLNMTYI